MTSRRRIAVLDVVAHGLAAPCLAAAFVLYFLVTWVPASFPRRELLCGSLVLAGLGAGLVNISGSRRGARVAGAVGMSIGLAGALGWGMYA